MTDKLLKDILKTLESIDKRLRRIERYIVRDTMEDNSDDEDDEAQE